MRRNTLIGCLLLALSTLTCCTPPAFEEEEEPTETPETPEEENNTTPDTGDSPTYDTLTWEGETGKFRFEDEGSIRLYDTGDLAGTAYISTALTTPDRTCWQLQAHLSFNPSANNHARFYLMAVSSRLHEHPDGYFLQIGGEEDRVYFYRQWKGEETLLCQSAAFMQGDSSPEAYIRVERDSHGYFWFYASAAPMPDRPVGFFKDTALCTATHCGLLCTYTASNSRKMRFTDVRIHHDVTDVEELGNEGFHPAEGHTPNHQ